MKFKFSDILKASLSLGLGCFLFWYFFHQMNFSEKIEFYNLLKNANYGWILLSILLSFLTFLLRAERWKLALEPLDYTTKFGNRYHSLMIGYIVNAVFPRAGELSRAFLLSKKEHLSFSETLGTIFSERFIDLLLLGTIGVIAYFMNQQHFIQLYQELSTSVPKAEAPHLSFYLFLFIAFLFITGISIYIFNKKIQLKINQFIRELFRGILSIFRLKRWFLYCIYSLLIWGLYVGDFWICFFSIPETSNYPASVILLTFIAGTIGVILTNGGIGAFPLLFGITLSIVDSSTENIRVIGNSLGMLIWSSQTFLVILLGIISIIVFKRKTE